MGAVASPALAEPLVLGPHYLASDVGGSVPDTLPYAPIACVSAGNCTTVGPYNNQSGAGVASILTETSGTWGTPRAVALPANALTAAAGGYSGLNGLACWSAGNCVAVGFYAIGVSFDDSVNPAPVPMAVDEVDGVWGTAQQMDLPASTDVETGELSAVSCDTSGDCTALGYYVTVDFSSNVEAPYPFAVTEAAGVTTWTAASDIPIDSGAPDLTYPTAVSCSAATTCVAIEDVLTGPVTEYEQNYFVDEVDGVWGDPVAVAKAGSETVELDALSCPAVGDCVATGVAAPTSADLAAQVDFVPAVDVSSSGTWAAPRTLTLPFLSPLTNEGYLPAVSCASASLCVATGGALESPTDTDVVPLVAADVDGTWSTTLDPTSLVDGSRAATVSVLAGVDCLSPTSCVGIGGAGTGTFEETDRGAAFESTIDPTQEVHTPGKPADVKVVAGAAVTKVTFAPPTTDGGSRVTSMTVTATTPGEPTRTCSTPGTSCTFRGAVKGRRYHVTVTATNAAGTSAPSPARTFVAL